MKRRKLVLKGHPGFWAVQATSRAWPVDKRVWDQGWCFGGDPAPAQEFMDKRAARELGSVFQLVEVAAVEDVWMEYEDGVPAGAARVTQRRAAK